MKLTIKMTMKQQNSIWISHKNIRLSTNSTRFLTHKKKKKKNNNNNNKNKIKYKLYHCFPQIFFFDHSLIQSFKFQIIRFSHLISICFQYNFFMQSTLLSLSKQRRCRKFK